jgi:hypothetical protein
LETIAKLCTYYNSNAKKELSYFASEMTEKELLEILKQTNIKSFKKILEKEDLDKNDLLLSNDLENLDSSVENNIITKDDLVLFLETSLDLEDEIFIDDLEKFPDEEDNDEDLLIEINENLDTINEETSRQDNYYWDPEQEDYNWNPEDLLNSDDD